MFDEELFLNDELKDDDLLKYFLNKYAKLIGKLIQKKNVSKYPNYNKDECDQLIRISVYEAILTYDPLKGTFYGYLGAVIENCLGRFKRSLQLQKNIISFDASIEGDNYEEGLSLHDVFAGSIQDNPVYQCDVEFYLEAIDNHFATLPKIYKQVYDLTSQGYTSSEISETLNLDYRRITNITYHNRKAIKRILSS